MGGHLPLKITPELMENARYRYEETDEPIASIAADIGCHKGTLQKKVKQWGWRLRKDRPPRDVPPDLRLLLAAEKAVRAAPATALPAEQSPPDATGVAGESTTPATPADPTLAERLEREVAKQLSVLENMRAQVAPLPQGSIDAERVARTLARLTETLSRVQRLRASPNARIEGSSDDDDLPKDPDAFREALARRIEAFVRGRRAGGAVPAAGEPAGGGEPRS